MDTTIAEKLGEYFLERGKSPKEAGRLAGHIVGRITIWLAAMGPIFNGMNYWGELKTPDDARKVTLFPKTVVAKRPDPVALGLCSTTCPQSGSIPFKHPTWGDVVLYTFGPIAPGEYNAAVIDPSGKVRWSLPGNAEERWGYLFEPGVPPTDASGLIFLKYNPGRYDGVTVLQPIQDGMRLVAGTYSIPGEQSLYYARLEKPGADGLVTIIHSQNDCNPSCAGGTTTEERLKWNGYIFAPPQ